MKPELGDKQLCPNCAAKFYDLRRRPATCPKCATVFDPADETVKLKRTRVRNAAYTPDYEDAEERKEKVRRTAAADADDDGPADDDDEEADVEETAELDADPAVEAVDLVEDEDEDAASADALPPGFSEAEEDGDLEDAVDEDDGVPLLEEDEVFEEGDIEVAEGVESEEER